MENQLKPINPSGDYGSNQDYLKKVDHDADMEAIRRRLDAIETRTKDRSAVVATLEEVFGEGGDHNIDPIMASYFKSGRVDLKPAVQSAVKEVDRDWFKGFLKKIGLGAWTLIVALISGAGILIFQTLAGRQ